MMKADLERTCPDHPDRHDCSDMVIFHHKDDDNNDEWGIYIKDGGQSIYRIYFCPWCGIQLATQDDD
ncbi:DUF6980 family protein [Litorimonas sp. WD9-15]|uniref:DUF6980 family protein n=1 Tax=Litorimonas sp. WD9-15 TaxID=3418716 RepID=UPI003D062A51